MMKPNNDLRLLCRGYGIPLWLVAQRLGISDQTLYRSWREELTGHEREKVIMIIEEIANEEVQDNEKSR